MKHLVILISVILLKSCGSAQNVANVTNDQEMNKRTAEVVKMNVTYNATTRGFFERIWLEDNTIKFTNDRSLQEISSFQISEADLIELSALYSTITIEDIPSLEPPSKTFAYDAAAIATLEVIKDEVSYKTQAFDHGTPPKPIARFVDKLIALKKAMEKQ